MGDGILKEFDEPVISKSAFFMLFKKKTLFVYIHYEDGTYIKKSLVVGKSYSFVFRKREYLIIPKCIIRGKKNMIHYFFNNPFPLMFTFEKSKLTNKAIVAEKLSEKDISNLPVPEVLYDGDTLYHAFQTQAFKGIHPVNMMTTKQMLLIFIVVAVIIVATLQATGVIDITTWFT